MRSKRNLTRKLNVGGKIIEATTIRGLAEIIGKSKDTILRYEQLGYFPAAILTLGGYRYYPLSLCNRLKPIVRKFPINKSPSADLIVEVNKVFNEERSKLCQS